MEGKEVIWELQDAGEMWGSFCKDGISQPDPGCAEYKEFIFFFGKYLARIWKYP